MVPELRQLTVWKENRSVGLNFLYTRGCQRESTLAKWILVVQTTKRHFSTERSFLLSSQKAALETLYFFLVICLFLVSYCDDAPYLGYQK